MRPAVLFRLETPMRPIAARILTLGSLASMTATALRGQCVDGTPPPCAARVVARTSVAVAVPGAQLRARRYLVLPFRNVTRQSEQEWLVEGSTTLLSESLGRWEGITVVSDERLYPALKRAGIAPGTVIEPVRVRRVAEETGGWTAVSGEILSIGGKVRITARAWDVPTSRELVRAISEVPATVDVRVAYDSVGSRLLRAAGLDLAASDIAGTTTRNLDAYRAYVRGLTRMRRSELESAFADFQESVSADSMFALGWARLSQIRSMLVTQLANGTPTLFPPWAAPNAARAAALSSGLPPRQRQFVLAIDAIARSQFGEARRLLETLVSSDTTDLDALQQLIALEAYDVVMTQLPGGFRPRGSRMRAAQLAKRAIALDPSWSQMYGLLASLYAEAGSPTPALSLGVERAPASFTEFDAQRKYGLDVRLFYPLLRDSLALVPGDSLATIQKDSLAAARKRARVIARAWAERWVASAKDVAAPYQKLAQLDAWDGNFSAAVRTRAKADSLLGSSAQSNGRVWQMMLLGKAGDTRTATIIADSLIRAGFFKQPQFVEYWNAAAWAFHLELLAGNGSRAASVLNQVVEFNRGAVRERSSAGRDAVRAMLGLGSPDAELGISRALRGNVLDSLAAHFDSILRSDSLNQRIPYIVPLLARAADTSGKRSRDALDLASRLASSGKTEAAFELLSNLVVQDSTAEIAAATIDWYRSGAAALNAARASRTSRFEPARATVTASQAVFEWNVRGSEPFVVGAPETPPGALEYFWEVRMIAGEREHLVEITPEPKEVGQLPSSGALSAVLKRSTLRQMTLNWIAPDGKPSALSLRLPVTLETLRTETAPGVFRVIVTDPVLLDEWRRTKPAEARFRFGPCARPIGVVRSGPSCTDQRVAITYQ